MLKKLLQSDGEKVSRTEKTLALTIASTVNTLLTLLLSMIAARVLSKTEIAINSQTILAYSTVSPFLTLGITNGIYYYLAQNDHRKRAAVNECIVPVFVTSGLFALFLLLGGSSVLAAMFHNPALSETLYWMIPYALLITPTSILSLVFVYENRLRFNAVFSTIQTFAILVVVLLVMLWFRTGQSMVVSRVLISCSFALITFYLAYSILPRDNGRISGKNIRTLLAISIPLGLSSVVSTLSHDLDKWIISAMLTPEIYAVYAQGARELPLIGTITGSINTVLIVDLTKAAKEKNYPQAAALFREAAAKTSLFLMPVMVFAFAAAEPLISFLYTNDFADAVPVFRIYLLYMPVRTIFFGPFLIALGKARTVLLNSIGCLAVNAVLSVLFVYFFGGEGAALATVLATMGFLAPANLLAISKETGISWKELLPFGQVFQCILFSIPGGVCSVAAGAFLSQLLPTFWVLVVEFAVFALVTLPLFIWRFRVSPRAIYARIRARFGK